MNMMKYYASAIIKWFIWISHATEYQRMLSLDCLGKASHSSFFFHRWQNHSNRIHNHIVASHVTSKPISLLLKFCIFLQPLCYKNNFISCGSLFHFLSSFFLPSFCHSPISHTYLAAWHWSKVIDTRKSQTLGNRFVIPIEYTICGSEYIKRLWPKQLWNTRVCHCKQTHKQTLTDNGWWCWMMC